MDTPDFDVVVIGAGVSGINTAYRLQTQTPHLSYTILESRTDVGGTWDLFRYPGIRSDSDLYTFGFQWRLWAKASPIADAASIKSYVKESAEAQGIMANIRFRQRVEQAAWSTKTSLWSLTTTTDGDDHHQERTIRCRFVVFGTGYYDYLEPLKAAIPGLKNFEGDVVHPQFWPETLDLQGKRVIIVGSGATAITLLPSIAQQAERVVMLQRSPSYILSLPQNDTFRSTVQTWLPASWVVPILRWRYLIQSYLFYNFCRFFPNRARRLLKHGAALQLPPGYNVDPNFNPDYKPWDQRLCLCPDGDFYKAIRTGSASVMTDTIKTVTKQGIITQSTSELVPADIIVTATGLKLQFGGGIQILVDGKKVDPSKKVAWRSTLLEDLPNAAFVVGYANASWTLGADCAGYMITRILNRMSKYGYSSVTPKIPLGMKMKTVPLIGLNSTYIKAASNSLPTAGSRGPWIPRQSYFSDLWASKYGGLTKDLVYK